MKKILNKISSIILGICCVLLLVIVVASFFGYKANIVMTGSMEPSIHTGSIVVTKPVEFNDLQKEDVVMYQANSITITHRIIDIDYDKQVFTPKGDANAISDGEISASKVLGKVIFTIPIIGYVIFFIQAYLVIVIAAILVIILISYIIKTIKKKE